METPDRIRTDKTLHETVFGVEVGKYFRPVISDEHELFKWMDYDSAYKNLEFDSNKESLKKLFLLISE